MDELPNNKEELERLLEKGIEAVISMEHRVPLLEEMHGIHPGEVYQIIVGGLNPIYKIRYMGVLDSMSIFAKGKECWYSAGAVVLKDGYMDGMDFAPEPFDVLKLPSPGDRVLGFGGLYPKSAEKFKKIRAGLIKKP